MWWTGLSAGDSRTYAESLRVERKLDKLLEGIAYAWESFGFDLHGEAFYDAERHEVHAPVKGGGQGDGVDLYVWYEGQENQGETYLMVGWYAKGRRQARRLAEQAARSRALELPGVQPLLEDFEWYVRELPLGELENLDPADQWARVVDFLKETVRAVEQSGIL